MIQREGLESVCKNLLLVMSLHCMLLVHIYGVLLIYRRDELLSNNWSIISGGSVIIEFSAVCQHDVGVCM